MNILYSGKSYSKMYPVGSEPRYNDLRYNDENREIFPDYNDIISIHSQIEIIEFYTIILQ